MIFIRFLLTKWVVLGFCIFFSIVIIQRETARKAEMNFENQSKIKKSEMVAINLNSSTATVSIRAMNLTKFALDVNIGMDKFVKTDNLFYNRFWYVKWSVETIITVGLLWVPIYYRLLINLPILAKSISLVLVIDAVEDIKRHIVSSMYSYDYIRRVLKECQ